VVDRGRWRGAVDVLTHVGGASLHAHADRLRPTPATGARSHWIVVGVWQGDGMAGYSPTPLAGKLGIRAGHRVLLDGAPADLHLGDLPARVVVHRRMVTSARPYQVVVSFCGDRARLENRWPRLHTATTTDGALWIAWPKRASGLATDLGESDVRSYALTHGRVDVKVCAIDAVWSGLKNVIRVADRS
jgi:hypothetical protein